MEEEVMFSGFPFIGVNEFKPASTHNKTSTVNILMILCNYFKTLLCNFYINIQNIHKCILLILIALQIKHMP